MTIIHIASAQKREDIPEIADAKACDHSSCPGPKGFESGYGLAGGGMGPYVYCSTCGEVRGKSVDPDDFKEPAK